MKFSEQTSGLASEVIATLSAAHAAASKNENKKVAAILDDVFGSTLGVLGAFPEDAQATVTISGEGGESSVKVYVDIVVVPSGAEQQAKLDAENPAPEAATL
jgi:hypothetical protein